VAAESLRAREGEEPAEGAPLAEKS
jgi:hypothetical protein